MAYDMLSEITKSSGDGDQQTFNNYSAIIDNVVAFITTLQIKMAIFPFL